MRNRYLTLILAVGVLSIPIGRVVAQDTSTAEERAQWVETTHKLESSPLDDSVNKQGELALKQVSDAHDIHVPLCPGLLSGFNGMKYTYAHAITRQYMLASTAFLIENPEKASDVDAMNLAAVESVLKTYNAILQQKPEAKSKTLDDLLKKQSQGKLRKCGDRRDVHQFLIGSAAGRNRGTSRLSPRFMSPRFKDGHNGGMAHPFRLFLVCTAFN